MKMRPLRRLDVEITAPVQGERFDPLRGALRQHLPDQFERGCVSFLLIDSGYHAPAFRAHRENSDRSEFTGAELHFVRGESIIGRDVDQHECSIVFSSLQLDIQYLSDLTMRPIAADYEGSRQIAEFALAVDGYIYTVFVLLG
jgi:hypothetical protein